MFFSQKRHVETRKARRKWGESKGTGKGGGGKREKRKTPARKHWVCNPCGRKILNLSQLYEFIEAAITSTASTPAKSSKRTLHTSDKASLNGENQNPSVSIRGQRSHPRSRIPRRILKANPGGGGTPIHYPYGYVPPNVRGRGFEAPDFLERGIHFREQGIIFRTHESFSFVSSHLKYSRKECF